MTEVNEINITATKTIGNYTVKLAEVGDGHHVISYKVITDKLGEHHEATMHNDPLEAEHFYRARCKALS